MLILCLADWGIGPIKEIACVTVPALDNVHGVTRLAVLNQSCTSNSKKKGNGGEWMAHASSPLFAISLTNLTPSSRQFFNPPARARRLRCLSRDMQGVTPMPPAIITSKRYLSY